VHEVPGKPRAPGARHQHGERGSSNCASEVSREVASEVSPRRVKRWPEWQWGAALSRHTVSELFLQAPNSPCADAVASQNHLRRRRTLVNGRSNTHGRAERQTPAPVAVCLYYPPAFLAVSASLCLSLASVSGIFVCGGLRRYVRGPVVQRPCLPAHLSPCRSVSQFLCLFVSLSSICVYLYPFVRVSVSVSVSSFSRARACALTELHAACVSLTEMWQADGLTGGIPTSTTAEAGSCASTMYGRVCVWGGGGAAPQQGSLLPTGSANSFAYPYVDAGMPSYITATTGCNGYQIYPTQADCSGWGGAGYTASDIASFS
jgi:hypothetical protein